MGRSGDGKRNNLLGWPYLKKKSAGNMLAPSYEFEKVYVFILLPDFFFEDFHFFFSDVFCA